MRLFATFLLLGAVSLFGDPTWAESYDKAFAAAEKEHKGVMVMLSQKSCEACWYMENIVLKDDELVVRLEKNFIPLYLDINDDNIHGLAYIGTPTFYFKKSDGRTIKRVDGALNIKDFADSLTEIEKSQ
ncbi:MAG: thioredoxin family protein [Thiovulaceae bacterium]|nr:thioredoxin family protein [Sulfurimonadaceae bacterium]